MKTLPEFQLHANRLTIVVASAHIGLPSLPLVVQVPLVANTCSGPHLCSDGRLLLAGG